MNYKFNAMLLLLVLCVTRSNQVYCQAAYKWEKVTVNPWTIHPSIVTADRLYYYDMSATQKNDLYESKDKGQTWNLKLNVRNEYLKVFDDAKNIPFIVGNDSLFLIEAQKGQNILISRDRGATWKKGNVPQMEADFKDVRITERGIVLIFSGKQISVSKDYGDTFVVFELPAIIEPNFMLNAELLHERIYLSVGEDLYWSDNYGESWSKSVQSIGEIFIMGITDLSGFVIMWHFHGVMYCNKNDNIWKPLKPINPAMENGSSRLINIKGKIYGEASKFDENMNSLFFRYQVVIKDGAPCAVPLKNIPAMPAGFGGTFFDYHDGNIYCTGYNSNTETDETYCIKNYKLP